MTRVFISYHHALDQWAKDELQKWNEQHGLFTDMSVNSNEVDDSLSTERIREIIRDDYLRDSTVTIVLVGTGTCGRKHVDWEIYSSMFNGKVNKQSGIFAIQLPSTNPQFWTAAHEEEKATIYPDCTSWTSITDRAEYERRYPYLPDRLIDNLLAPKAKVSVTTWDRITSDLNNLVTLIEILTKTDCLANTTYHAKCARITQPPDRGEAVASLSAMHFGGT
jgi:hypothetical protein